MADLQQTLNDLHRELSGARNLGPEERVMLETALDEIRRALHRDAGLSAVPAPRAEGLENAAVRLEASHPTLAGAVRALVDALAKAGI